MRIFTPRLYPFLYLCCDFRSAVSILGILCLSSACLAAPPVDAENSLGSSRWEFGFGPVYRSGLQMSTDWRADAVLAYVPSQLFGASSQPNVGSLNGYADREYVDGFVYTDPGTTDSETDVYGMTWNWGYNDSGQYQGNSVVFHSATVTDASEGAFRQPWSEEQTVSQTGFDVSAGCRLLRGSRLALGFSTGVSWFPERTEQSAVVRRGGQTTWRYVDSYSAPYTPFPSAPYSGTTDGPGYLLSNIPDSRNIEVLSRTAGDWGAVSTLDVGVGLTKVRIGPSLWGTLGDLVVARLSAQSLWAYVETSATSSISIESLQSDTVTFGDNSYTREWVSGWGVEGEARMVMGEGWYLGLAVAADWWSEEVSISVTSFDVELDLGQWNYAITVGRAF